MPRRKRNKCTPTLSALRKKKCSAEQYNKEEQRVNVSAQRFRKPKSHSDQWNYVKYTGSIPTYKENEKEEEDEEDTFSLSPAYLCECTLQTQDVSVAPEDPSKEYCFKKGTLQTNLLKRKELPSNDKVIKNNDISHQNQEYSPAFLCESILQAEDTSVVSGPDPSTDYVSKNILLRNNPLKKKKQQLNNKNYKHCEFNIKGQECCSEYLYRSKSQSKNTSVVSDPDPPKVYFSKNRLLESNPLNKRKLRHNSKELKVNEENNHVHEYSAAFLCESVILSEETSVVSESDPSKENCSANVLLGGNPHNKTRPQRRSKKLQNNEINNKTQEYSSENLSERTVKYEDSSGVSKSGPTKEYCSESSVLERNPKNKKKQHNSKKLKSYKINKKAQQYSVANLGKSTLQFEDTSMLSESDPLKENCSTNGLLGRNLHIKTKPQRRSKKIKNNDLNNKAQVYSSENLSRSTVQYVDSSGLSESKHSDEFCFENILESHHQDSKKPQRISKRKINNEINNKHQQYGLVNISKSTLQSKNTSVLSESDPSKEYCSENKLLESIPQESKKPRHNSKRKRNIEINNKAQECSPANLCNDTFQFDDFSVISKSDPIKVNCSKSRLHKRNPLRKKNLRQNNKKLETVEVNSNIQEDNPAFPCESKLDSEDTSGVSKSGSLRKSCIKNRFLENNPLNKKEPQNNSKRKRNNEINNKAQQYNLANHSKRTLQFEDTSVLSESNSSKKYCSENKLLESQPQDSKKPRHNSKRKGNNEINKGQECIPVNLCNDALKYEDFSVISNSDLIKVSCSKTRLHKRNSPRKNNLRQNSKELKTDEVNNHTQENNPAFPCESKLDSEDISGVSKSRSLRKSCYKNHFLENNLLNKKQPQNKIKEPKSNKIIYQPQEHSPLHLFESTSQCQEPAVVSESDSLKKDCYKNRLSERNSLKKKEVFCNDENNKGKNNEINPAFIDENMLQAEGTSFASESNPSLELSSKNGLLEKRPVNYEELHSDIDPINNEVNNQNRGNIIEEISFIECNLYANESKHSKSSEFIQDESDANQRTIEADPLEWHSTVLDELECNPKDVDSKENNLLETETTQNSFKVMNSDNVSEGGSLDCDLHLECTLEDSEPLESDFQDTDCCNSEISDFLGSVSPSFDITVITQSLERFSISNFELICNSVTIPCNLKVTSETVKMVREDDSKIETKDLENMGKEDYMEIQKLLESHSGKVKSIESEIMFNQTKADDEISYAESGESHTKEDHSLQCIDSKSSILNSEESSSLSIQEEIKKTDSVVDSENKSEVPEEKCDLKSEVLEKNVTKDELAEFSSSEKSSPKDEPTECCPLKNQPGEVKYCPFEDNQSLFTSLLIKNDIDSDSMKEDGEKNTFSHLTGETSDESYGRASREVLPTSGFIKVSKERLNFHEERVLKVLLRRLEDEEIFNVWKKDGVISLLKHSCSKTTLGWKRTHSLRSNIQKSLKKRKNYKCCVCKKIFKNRERYWEHKASKCDRVRVFGCGNCNRKYILKKMLDEHRAKCISVEYFRCKVCLKLFNSQERLDEHNASICDTQKVFRCDVCDRGFIFKRLLLIHRTPICTSLRRYKCSICLQSFDKTNLKTHKLREHGIGIFPTILCEFCGKLVTRRHFSDHMNIHCDYPLYRCKVCSEVFRTKEARRHHEQYHLDSKPCICADCGKAFRRLTNLKKHVSGNGNFHKCNTCGKVIQNQFCFRAHVNSHIKVEDHSEGGLKCEIKQEPCDEEYSQCIDDEKPFKCSECEEIFTERITMEQHLKSIHQTPLKIHGSESKSEQYQGCSVVKARSFKCDRCNCCYSRYSNLIQHVQKVHDGLYEVKHLLEDKPFKCETCGNSFLKKLSLNRHCRRVHNAPSFVREIVKTSTHVRKVHDTLYEVKPLLEEKPFKCETCGNSFLKKSFLNRHRRRVHKAPTIVREIVKTPTHEKPYACDVCGTCFSERRHLSRHRSRVHRVKSGDRLYPYDFCDEKFKTDAHFKEHTFEHFKDCFSVTTVVKEEEKLCASSNVKIMGNDVKTPTQEKPYVCDICGNCFGDKRNLTWHHSQMHSRSPLYPCSFCNEKFKTDADLKDHTFQHFLNGFSVNTNIKKEEELFANTDVKEEGTLFVVSNLKHSEEASTSTDSKKEEGVINTDGLVRSFNGLALFENNPNNLHNQKSKEHACRECGKTFKTSYSKKRHVCLHKLNTLQRTIGRDIHACEECGVIFFEKWRLNKHLLSHSSETFKCDACKKCFTTRLKLSVHMLVHGKKTIAEPTFKCSTCSKLFPSSEKLERHLILHTEQNPYQCTKCNRKFTTPYSLKRHNINTHANKRFSCSYCKMSFVSFSSLNQHVTCVHKKSVSLTEYVLKIDDDLQGQTHMEADYPTVSNLQDEATAEINLQPQVFENISNMFMYSNLFGDEPLQSKKQSEFRQDVVNTNETISGLTGEKEAHSTLEVTIKIADR